MKWRSIHFARSRSTQCTPTPAFMWSYSSAIDVHTVTTIHDSMNLGGAAQLIESILDTCSCTFVSQRAV